MSSREHQPCFYQSTVWFSLSPPPTPHPPSKKRERKRMALGIQGKRVAGKGQLGVGDGDGPLSVLTSCPTHTQRRASGRHARELCKVKGSDKVRAARYLLRTAWHTATPSAAGRSDIVTRTRHLEEETTEFVGGFVLLDVRSLPCSLTSHSQRAPTHAHSRPAQGA